MAHIYEGRLDVLRGGNADRIGVSSRGRRIELLCLKLLESTAVYLLTVSTALYREATRTHSAQAPVPRQRTSAPLTARSKNAIRIHGIPIPHTQTPRRRPATCLRSGRAPARRWALGRWRSVVQSASWLLGRGGRPVPGASLAPLRVRRAVALHCGKPSGEGSPKSGRPARTIVHKKI